MNLHEFEPGSKGPLGHIIKENVFRSNEVIVYIDSNDTIQWYKANCENLPEQFGEIQNKVSEWESKVNRFFNKEDAYEYKLLLAEAYARILYNKDISQANGVIEIVVKRAEKIGKQILKQTYAIASMVAAAVVCLIIFIVKVSKADIEMMYGLEEYKILMTMLFGGIGAFIFTIVRLRKYEADIESSKSIHIVDGMLRIIYGIIFGLVMAVAIKANLLLGFLNGVEKDIFVFMFLGVCAGASEVIIPNLIKQIETKSKNDK